MRSCHRGLRARRLMSFYLLTTLRPSGILSLKSTLFAIVMMSVKAAVQSRPACSWLIQTGLTGAVTSFRRALPGYDCSSRSKKTSSL